MAVHVVPVAPGEAHQTLRPTLDGTTFELAIRWNVRAAAFFLDLYTAEREALALGQKVVIESPLCWERRYVEGMPQGMLLAWDTTPRKVDPLFDDFGSRVLLLYLDAASISEALAAERLPL